jgi:hypothetical protein
VLPLAAKAAASAASAPPPPPVLAKPPPPTAPQPIGGGSLVAVRGWLLSGEPEPTGFGAYSYLLFPTPPLDTQRELHLRLLMAYLRQLSDKAEIEPMLGRARLNLFQLPLKSVPKLPANPGATGDAGWRASAELLLQAYDHARAQVLMAGLRIAPGAGGPLLVTFVPAAKGTQEPDRRLIEDLSRAEPVVAEQWLTHSLELARRSEGWTGGRLQWFALQVRNLIAQVASAVPDIDARTQEWVRVSELKRP